MGRKCSVEGCLSDSNRPEDMGVTFHKVPMHSDVRPKWMALCRIPEDKKLIKIIYVCSRHFLRADFCNFKGKKYMLRQGVLPSVFPWDKSKLEAIKAEATVKKEKPNEKISLSIIKTENECSNIEGKTISEGVENLKQEECVRSNLELEIKTEVFDQVESKENLQGFEKLKPAQAGAHSISFTINSRIEALDFNNDWFPARIVEVDYEENEVLIHFEKFSSKYDEWICMNSSRLRPLQQQATLAKKVVPIEIYEVGERCLAAWSDSRKFSATVTKVMGNGTYEVLFDDGFVKSLKAHRMSKALGKPMQSSSLFDPIKTSKQDRRDKKRKLNVAALFKKRARTDNQEDKTNKSNVSQEDELSLNCASPQPQERAAQNSKLPKKAKTENDEDKANKLNTVAEVEKDEDQNSNPLAPLPDESDIQNWKPHWIKGKPVGIESTIVTQDGQKNSVIVPDPRLPDGWYKHLLRRTQGTAAGKWDTIILSPDNRRFRSRTDVKNYLDEHPIDGVNENMFDFSLVAKRKRKSNPTPKKPVEIEQVVPVPEPVEPEDTSVSEEANSSLKILFEENAYKCPIEGCGKHFRRENLAQMHVKHYHPKYTKFLDSTPNVADLAYARTVGENLARSPVLKATIRTSTPKISKLPQSPLPDVPDLIPANKPQAQAAVKPKDAEIIKLLNSKPFDNTAPEAIQPLPSGLPMNMYPDIKLKDLLNKAEAMPRRDDINLKSLCMSRPPVGIKTLLPVVRQPPTDTVVGNPSEEFSKQTGKRKRGFSNNIEICKGKESQQPPHPHQQHQQSTFPTQIPDSPSTLSPQTQPPNLPLETPNRHSPVPPNNIIIEGGEVIKIVRMKQEEIINCTCGFTEEDGLMIQCELCLCWQHAYCNNIERESQVPDKYICYICQNPLRERASRKYYPDQEWLKQGTLPVGSYHSKDEEAMQKRFEKLKKLHDLSGGLLELKEYLHSLSIKMKIAETKNHPKLYLWSKPWEKMPLPEKVKQEHEDKKPKKEIEDNEEYLKTEIDEDKVVAQNDSMLMMILKAGKEVMPKIDFNSLMDNNMGQLSGPTIPQPEAAIHSTDCRLNLLEHIIHQESLVEERLDDFEKQVEALEENMNVETDPDYPKTRHTLQMLMRDIDTLKEFSQSTTI